MIRVTHLCTDCVQVISNPICPHCFSKQVLLWLRDKNIPNYKMEQIKEKLRILANEAEETPSRVRCILCGSKRVNLCTYCFTNRADIIVRRNTNQNIVKNFNEDFDTQLWRIHI